MTTAHEMIPGVLRALRNYAIRLTEGRGGELAADLVQDTVERALARFPMWKPYPGVSEEESFRRWCFTLMHHRFFDDVRKRRRLGHHDELDLKLPNHNRGTHATQGDMLAYRAVTQTLATLSDADRDVIVLMLDETSVAQAARELGCAEGTVKSRLHRARGRLRRQLEDGGFDVPRRQP